LYPIVIYYYYLIVCLNLMVASSKKFADFFIIEFSKDHLIVLNPYFTSALSCLKGQCHEIFDFCFFSWISSPRPLSMLVANLSLVSLIPVLNLFLPLSPQICWKLWNGPNGSLWGLGETDSWKKAEAKNLNTVPLSITSSEYEY